MKEKQTNKKTVTRMLYTASPSFRSEGRERILQTNKSSAPLNWIDKTLITEDEHSEKFAKSFKR